MAATTKSGAIQQRQRGHDCQPHRAARIYFALGKNFDQMGDSRIGRKKWGNPVPWAMFEFDLSHHGCEPSNVDFFSLAYTARPEFGEHVTIGALISSVFSAFGDPLLYRTAYVIETAIFRRADRQDAAGEAVRVITQPAGDVSTPSPLPDVPHFLRDYINNLLEANPRLFRQQNCGKTPTPITGGSARNSRNAGDLYRCGDDRRMRRCRHCRRRGIRIQRQPGLWHNVGAAGTAPGEIDWGYLLYGQDGYVRAGGALASRSGGDGHSGFHHARRDAL